MDASLEMEEEFINSAGELINYLKENGKANEAATVFVIAAYVKEMDGKLDQVLSELTDVKQQLKDMQTEKEMKNLEGYLSDTTEQMTKNCYDLKNQMAEIKGELKEKATEIVEAVKKKGTGELNRISELFQIGKKLETFKEKVKNELECVDGTIDRIDAFETSMREAKREAVDALRVFTGREKKEYTNQGFSKTELVKKPFLIKRGILQEILKYTEKTILICDKIAQKGKMENEEPFDKADKTEDKIDENEKIIDYQKKRKGGR